MASLFETTTCGRCGGSGMYGPLSVEAGRCFGCAGTGRKLTKRGAAAQAFYRASFPTKRADALLAGETFRLNASDRWATVTGLGAIQRNAGSSTIAGVTTTYDAVTIEHTPIRGSFGTYSRTGVATDTVVTIRPDAETVRGLQAAALDYQASLTQQGKPRKPRRKGART